jgi:hypothetical protein
VAAGGAGAAVQSNTAGCCASGVFRERARSTSTLSGLLALGWVNGRNIQLEYRWAPGGQTDVLKRTAEMVAGAPDLGGKDGQSQRRT